MNSTSTFNKPEGSSKQSPAKKTKTSNNAPIPEPKSSGFCRLPVELLAEILLYTNSPRDVLAVARCSKYHCHTLMNPSNQFIWKYTRQHCKPAAMPDPPKKFTEAAYAAFVYDAGKCEACGTHVKEMMDSFSLRLRLCKKHECRAKYNSASSTVLLHDPNILESHQTFIETLPMLECSQSLAWGSGTPKYFPEVSPVYRSSQWAVALQDYLEASQTPDTFQKFIEECTIKSEWNLDFLKFCVNLHKWKVQFQTAYAANKIENMRIATQIALKEGHTVQDLTNTPTYGALLRNRLRILEQVTPKDYEALKPAIDTELIKVKEARLRAERENAYKNSRELVKKHYNRLRAGKNELPLPNLETFREIPIIRQLQNSPRPGTEADLDKEMKSDLVASLLKAQLNEWREEVKKELAGILGFQDWKSPSSNKLHPADRVTARWVCRTCQRVPMQYKEDECLDFPGVCVHQCSAPPGKKVKLKTFKAARFAKDEKAVAAMTKVLEACEIADEDPLSVNALESIGFRILCKSCEGGNIVMDPSSVVGHSHRHDEMDISLLKEEDAKAILKYPIERGLMIRLLGPENAKTSQVLRARKGYGCRHCVQVGVDSAKKPKQATAFSFDGLRSHLKEKHKVAVVRDEDFFYSEELKKANEDSEARKAKAKAASQTA